MATQIGFLVPNPHVNGFNVRCNACATRRISLQCSPIYDDNIYPFKQACAACGDTLVDGQTSLWPELYTNPFDSDDVSDTIPCPAPEDYYELTSADDAPTIPNIPVYHPTSEGPLNVSR